MLKNPLPSRVLRIDRNFESCGRVVEQLGISAAKTGDEVMLVDRRCVEDAVEFVAADDQPIV